MPRRCEFILPVCGGTSALDPGATLTARWAMSPGQSAVNKRDWGLHTLPDSIDPGNVRFRPRAVGVVKIWANFCSRDSILYSPGKARSRRRTQGQQAQRLGSMSPGQSAITQWDWGFHTLRGGIDPRDVRFRPKDFLVACICANVQPGDRNLSSPSAAGPRSWTEGQHSQRASSMSPGQSAITQWDWCFHTLRGGVDPGYVRFRRQFVSVVDI